MNYDGKVKTHKQKVNSWLCINIKLLHKITIKGTAVTLGAMNL